MKKFLTITIFTFVFLFLIPSSLIFADNQLSIKSLTSKKLTSSIITSSNVTSNSVTSTIVTSNIVTSTIVTSPSIISTTLILSDPNYITLTNYLKIKSTLDLEESTLGLNINLIEKDIASNTSIIRNNINKNLQPFQSIIDLVKTYLNPSKTRKYSLFNENNYGPETKLLSNQTNNLNMAIKYLRESTKFISLESQDYQSKINSVNEEVQKINLSNQLLSNSIVLLKFEKEIYWNNFIKSMNSCDIQSSIETYDKLINTRKMINSNYKTVLENKKNILLKIKTLLD